MKIKNILNIVYIIKLYIIELSDAKIYKSTFGVRPCAQLRAYNPAGGNPVK
ncbi:hypothetical protein I260019D6_12760 [Dorea longicatena]